MKTIGMSSYKTAAFAVARGHRVVNTSRSGRRVTFIFEHTPDLEDDLNLLRFDDPSVSVHALFTATAKLKSLIFDAPDDGGREC